MRVGVGDPKETVATRCKRGRADKHLLVRPEEVTGDSQSYRLNLSKVQTKDGGRGTEPSGRK